MKAIVTQGYGPPSKLKLEDVPKPAVGESEVLVKVHAAALNAADWHVQRADPFLMRFMVGLFRPKFKIPGADAAGRVEAVGKRVSSFRPGDEVFGDLSGAGWGAFAEYAAAPEGAWARKPKNASFQEAAAAPLAGVTALQGLRDHARLRPGQTVLVNGASGGVGTFAVQIAKALGAEVTAVCSTRNLALARNLGADHVVDYTKDDFTKNGNLYDVVFDTAAHRPPKEYRESLAPRGMYWLVGGSTKAFWAITFKGRAMSKENGKKFGTFIAKPGLKDLEDLAKLMESGRVKSVIDRTLPLHDASAALAYMEAGHTQGKVVLTVP